MNESKPKKKIATRLESMRRVHQTYQWLNEGLPNLTIIAKCVKDFGIGTRQAENIIARARNILQKQFEKDASGQMSDILKKLDRIHQKTMEGEIVVKDGIKFTVTDPSVARQALMDKAKILGLLTNKIDMTVNDERENTREDSDTLESIANQIH